MNETDPVRVVLAGGVLEITLNRPDRLNAFTEAVHYGLRAAFERAHTDPEVRAVLITGAGRGFCAGQDLGERDPDKTNGPRDLGASLESFYNPNMRLLRNLEKPVIAAVNGVAAGAGVGLALGCDIVLAAKSARFIQAFTKIGLCPDAGCSWALPHLIGEARAKALALTAEPLDAETAERWGLIWRAVDDAALMDEARALAARLAQGPTRALGMTKIAIQSASTNSYDEQLDLERDTQRRAGLTEDSLEGVRAFLEKRPPAFRGA